MHGEQRILKEHRGRLISERTDSFCFESIVIVARTYKMKECDNKYNNCAYAKNAEKIYNVEVIVDGRTVHDFYSVNADTANKDWKNWKCICASEEI
jgi:hypothetical protein